MPNESPIIVRDLIHGWFGLTYANYLVLPRSVMQSMPDEWQEKMVKLLNEARDEFPDLKWPEYEVNAVIREEKLRRGPGGETKYKTTVIDDPIPHYDRGRTRLKRIGAE